MSDFDLAASVDAATAIVEVHLERLDLIRGHEPNDATIFAGERAIFRVTKAWKGPKRVGDVVVVENLFTYLGGCYRYVRNSPKWMIFEDANGKAADPPPSYWNDWLIYATGPEPWHLSKCDRSNPLQGAPSKEDLPFLAAMNRPRESAAAQKR